MSINNTLLHKAFYSGNISKLQELLNDNTININLQDKNGETVLHIASRKGNKDIVLLLLKYGANIDIKNNFLTKSF